MSEPNTPSGAGNPLRVLTRKVGPLPGWAWVALAISAYAVYKLYQGRHNVGTAMDSNPSDTQVQGSQVDTGTNTDPSLNGGGLGSGTVNTGGVGGINTSTPVGPVTNAQWASTAMKILIAGGANPTAVENALTKFIRQDKAGLSSSERSIVNAAIAQLGPPPEGLLPITSTPTTPKAPTYRTYTTKKGDTFQTISRKFFGSPTAASGRIRSANPGLSSYSVTQKLPAGKVLRIPMEVTYKSHT